MMSTRALIIVKDDAANHDLVTLYKHSDGYPTAIGAELKTFLESHVLCNGIPGTRDDRARRYANGMGDLAAQLVGALKSEWPVGQVYIVSNGTKGMDEEWLYVVSGAIDQPFRMKIYHVGGKRPAKVFDGPIDVLNPAHVEGAICSST
jgi:hypothetical protein